MSKRILHFFYDQKRERVLAGDHQGIVYALDKELNILKQSDPLKNGKGLYILIADEEKIYARDTTGNLIVWDAETLEAKDFLFMEHLTDEKLKDEDSAPVPTVSHSLAFWKDKLVITNPHGQLVFLNKKTLALEKIHYLNNDAFFEAINTEQDLHILTDCIGNLWTGHFSDGVFEKKLRLDHGNLHNVRFDKIHERYWMPTDNHKGIVLLDKNCEEIERVYMTNDDTEWIEFNHDHTKAFVACFDHHLYIFDKTQKTPKLINKVGPFKFQLKQVLYVDDDHIYVNLESGEIYWINIKGEHQKDYAFGTNCIWDLVPSQEDPSLLYCPMEDGGLTLLHYDAAPNGVYELHVEKKYKFDFGRMRRVFPLKNKDFVGGCTNGTFFRADSKGNVLWTYKSKGIIRDLSVHEDHGTVFGVNEFGEAIELDLKTGKEIWKEKFEKSLWACSYYKDDFILFSERSFSPKDQGTTSSGCDANLYVYDKNKKKVREIYFSGNIKRIQVQEDGNVLLNGNGNVNTSLIDIHTGKTLKIFEDWQLNTCEGASIIDDYLYTVTYGYQINTYKMTGEVLDSQFSPENYPKAVIADVSKSGVPLAVVAGRGAFVTLYDIRNVVPTPVRTIYL